MGFHNGIQDIINDYFSEESEAVIKAVEHELMTMKHQAIDGDGKTFFKPLMALFKHDYDAIQKALTYKVHAPKLNIDCDVSLRRMIYFKLVFGVQGCLKHQWNAKHKFEIQSDLLTYRGDTMTSFWTPFKNALFLYKKDYHRVCREVGIDEKASLMSQLNIFIAHAKAFMSVFPKEIEDALQRFARNYHTLGNFIPIPLYFNVARSGCMSRYDSWDLTLGCIFRWYKRNVSSLVETDDASLKQLFKYSWDQDVSIHHCKIWLQRFGTWDHFVESHELQDFVNAQTGDVETYENPIVFYAGHSLDNPLPQNETDLLTFLNTVNETIESREARIDKKRHAMLACVL